MENLIEKMMKDFDNFKAALVRKYEEEANAKKEREEKLKREEEEKQRVEDTVRPSLLQMPYRESMVPVSKIKETMAEMIKDNAKSSNEDVSKVLERIADPNIQTVDKKIDEYGMTQEQRDWLFKYIYCVEGYYMNHPNDPGGATMYGITEREARKWGYKGRMQDLPKELSLRIYLHDYWEKWQLKKINHFGKALCIFDFIVNSGTRGIKIAQKCVNRAYQERNVVPGNKEELSKLSPIAEDGVIGPKTIEAINNCPFMLFYSNYIVAQEDQYEDLMRANSKLRSFDEGWENRIYRKNQFIYRMIADNIITIK